MFFNKSYRYNQFSKLMDKELYMPACVLILMDSNKSVFDSKVRKRVHDFVRNNFSDKVPMYVLDALQSTTRDNVSLVDLQLLLRGSGPLETNVSLSRQIDSLSFDNLATLFINVRHHSNNFLYEEDLYRIAKRIYDWALKNPESAFEYMRNKLDILREMTFDMSNYPEEQLVIARLWNFYYANCEQGFYQKMPKNADSAPLTWSIDKCSKPEDFDLGGNNMIYIRIMGEDKMMSSVIDYMDKAVTNPLISDKHYNQFVLSALQHGLNRIAAYIMERRGIKAVTKLCKDLITNHAHYYTLKDPHEVLFAKAAKDLTPAARESLYDSMQTMAKQLDNIADSSSSPNYKDTLHRIHWIETINKLLDEKRPEKIKVAKPRASKKKAV